MRYIHLLVAAWGVAASAPASAQDCASLAQETLGAARRARSILDSRRDFDRRHALEQDLVYDAAAQFEEEPPRFQLYGEWVSEISEITGYGLCSGELTVSAGLAGGWNGFAIGGRDLESQLALRLFYLSGGDALSPDDFRPVGEPGSPEWRAAIESSGAFGTGQEMYGVSFAWTQWVSLTLALTRDANTFFDISEEQTDDGVQVSATARTTPIEGAPSSLYVGLGHPPTRTTLDVLFDPGSAGLSYTFFGVRGLPAFFLDPRLFLTAGGGYIDFEGQPLAELGAAYALFDGLVLPSVDTAFEFNSPRLRYARARVDVNWFQRMRIPEGVFVDDDNGSDLATLVPWFGLGLSAFGSANVFNSGYMERVTGEGMALGWRAGGALRLFIRMFTVDVELYQAMNDVETLTRLADARDRGEGGVKLQFRVGW